jgi:hypothetical protein
MVGSIKLTVIRSIARIADIKSAAFGNIRTKIFQQFAVRCQHFNFEECLFGYISVDKRKGW